MSAIFSACGLYRLRLEREISPILPGAVAALIGVNPSTAGELVNDMTIRKDIGFAKLHGWARIIKGNKFAFRATDVRELATADDPIGADNDDHLDQIFADADLIVPCWGPLSKLPARLRGRRKDVDAMMRATGKPVMCLGIALDGQPLHTSRIPYSSPLAPWSAPHAV